MEKVFTQEYKDYLQSDLWRETARKRKDIDGNKCVLCGAENGLQVHHRHYRTIGHEDIEKDLVTLCNNCHKEVHENKDDVVAGICSGILLGRILELQGGIDAFLQHYGISNRKVRIKGIKQIEDGMTFMFVPVPDQERGAIVVPYSNFLRLEKEQEKMADYLGEDLVDVRINAIKLYYFGLENGGFIGDEEMN